MEPITDPTSKPAAGSVQKIPLKELTAVILSKWRWIILSLMVCMGLAVLYLAWKPFSYSGKHRWRSRKTANPALPLPSQCS
ncbi:MAG: hypothetical protein K2L00_06100, partial [Muribaculaceae bacterium]|nr:hypothetical protein [Muribaculaceae bacterium]